MSLSCSVASVAGGYCAGILEDGAATHRSYAGGGTRMPGGLTIPAGVDTAQRHLGGDIGWFRPVVIGFVQFGVDKWSGIWDTYASTTLAISLIRRMVRATQGSPYPWMIGLAQGAPSWRLPDSRLTGSVSRPRCQPREFEAEETACGLVVLG